MSSGQGNSRNKNGNKNNHRNNRRQTNGQPKNGQPKNGQPKNGDQQKGNPKDGDSAVPLLAEDLKGPSLQISFTKKFHYTATLYLRYLGRLGVPCLKVEGVKEAISPFTFGTMYRPTSITWNDFYVGKICIIDYNFPGGYGPHARVCNCRICNPAVCGPIKWHKKSATFTNNQQKPTETEDIKNPLRIVRRCVTTLKNVLKEIEVLIESLSKTASYLEITDTTMASMLCFTCGSKITPEHTCDCGKLYCSAECREDNWQTHRHEAPHDQERQLEKEEQEAKEKQEAKELSPENSCLACGNEATPEHTCRCGTKYCTAKCREDNWQTHQFEGPHELERELEKEKQAKELSPENSCDNCNGPRTQGVSCKCGKTKYCTRECFRAHWDAHKTECAWKKNQPTKETEQKPQPEEIAQAAELTQL